MLAGTFAVDGNVHVCIDVRLRAYKRCVFAVNGYAWELRGVGSGLQLLFRFRELIFYPSVNCAFE